jgi:hypothetical protein
MKWRAETSQGSAEKQKYVKAFERRRAAGPAKASKARRDSHTIRTRGQRYLRGRLEDHGGGMAHRMAASKKKFRESTCDAYTGIIEKHLLQAPIAGIGLQKFRAMHIEQ